MINLNRKEYSELIEKDLKWLERHNKACPELNHIASVLNRSIELEYGPLDKGKCNGRLDIQQPEQVKSMGQNLREMVTRIDAQD